MKHVTEMTSIHDIFCLAQKDREVKEDTKKVLERPDKTIIEYKKNRSFGAVRRWTFAGSLMPIQEFIVSACFLTAIS